MIDEAESETVEKANSSTPSLLLFHCTQIFTSRSWLCNVELFQINGGVYIVVNYLNYHSVNGVSEKTMINATQLYWRLLMNSPLKMKSLTLIAWVLFCCSATVFYNSRCYSATVASRYLIKLLLHAVSTSWLGFLIDEDVEQLSAAPIARSALIIVISLM